MAGSLLRRAARLGVCVLIAGGIGLAPARSATEEEPWFNKGGWLTGPALADKDGEGKDWSVDIVPYAWLVNIDGRVGSKAAGTIPINTTFSNVRSNLEGAFAGFLDARWRRWHLLVDGSWANVTDTVAAELPGVLGVDIDSEIAFGMVGPAYELPLPVGFAVDVYVAARWWLVSNGVQIRTVAPTFQGSSSESWGDVVFGTRLRQNITENWGVSFIADIGAGGANLDWNVFGGLHYMFNRHFGLTAGYRINGVDYQRNGFVYDVTQQGLLLGLRIGF